MERVLVNLVSLSGGAANREREILRAIDDVGPTNHYDVLCNPQTATEIGSLGERFTCHEVGQPESTPERILWENVSLLSYIHRLNPDVLYFPLHITNLVNQCPKVSVIHNAAPFYRDAFKQTPVRSRARLRALRAATRVTVRQSDAVVFLSRTTLEKLAEYIPRAKAKGVVVPPGRPQGFNPTDPDPDVIRDYDLPDRFALSVSNVARYKNLLELVDGYAVAAERYNLPPLCIAGKVVDEEYFEQVKQRIAARGLREAIRFIGYVDRKDLPDLHAASEFFVFSSTCENAPLSLIEALACGSAIASSSAASMPEMCEDAAVYFDPYDASDIAEALGRLASDAELRTRLSEASVQRAAAFSWTTAARETDKLLGRVASQ